MNIQVIPVKKANNVENMPVEMTVDMIVKLVDSVRFQNLLSIRAASQEIGVSPNVFMHTRQGKTSLSLMSISKYIKFLNKYGYNIKLVESL